MIFLSSFTGAMAFEQNACSQIGDQICEKSKFDYHASFYKVEKEAFIESLNDSEMRDLICRSFVREGGKLKADFSFERECWFWSFERILKKKNVKSCEDFTKFGADQNFLANCHDAQNKKLSKYISNRAGEKLERVIEKVKAGMFEAFADDSRLEAVTKALDNILVHGYPNRNLYKLKAEFISSKELCDKHFEPTLCGVYRSSNKLTLSLGGYIFLPPETLETLITKKIAEYVAESIHKDLYNERLFTYARYISKESERSTFERAIARSNMDDKLNKSTNTLLVLRKYYEKERAMDGEGLKVKAGYFCYQDPRLGQSRRSSWEREWHYLNDFRELYRADQAEVIACQEDPAGANTALWDSFESNKG